MLIAKTPYPSKMLFSFVSIGQCKSFVKVTSEYMSIFIDCYPKNWLARESDHGQWLLFNPFGNFFYTTFCLSGYDPLRRSIRVPSGWWPLSCCFVLFSLSTRPTPWDCWPLVGEFRPTAFPYKPPAGLLQVASISKSVQSNRSCVCAVYFRSQHKRALVKFSV